MGTESNSLMLPVDVKPRENGLLSVKMIPFTRYLSYWAPALLSYMGQRHEVFKSWEGLRILMHDLLFSCFMIRYQVSKKLELLGNGNL